MSNHTNHQASAVVLLSGGLDSAVALAVTRQQMPVLLALTVNYGQRAFTQEAQAAAYIAQWAGVPQKVINLPWLADLLPEGMQTQASTLGGDNAQTLQAVWVPNRNGLLLNIAGAFAEHMGATHVVFGANADEGQAFLDNTAAYRDAVTHALGFSTRNQVQVYAPLAHSTKPDLWQLGQQLGVPLAHTWSCYTNKTMPCGVCLSCQHRQRAEAVLS